MFSISIWLCLIPIAIACLLGAVAPKRFPWKECLLVGGLGSVILLAGWAMMINSKTADTEILNGQVTSVERDRVPCSHSYSCNCRQSCSGSGSNRSCHQTCSTCHEHSNDWDWLVHTTVGTVEIDRVDRRGSDVPPRWAAVVLHEPAAVEHSYKNWIKAAPQSLFNTKYVSKAPIPAWPRVYDYYRVKHAVAVGLRPDSYVEEWSTALGKTLRTLGPDLQTNVLVVFVGGQRRTYKSEIERMWLGGKKNEVIILIGTDGTKVDWVEAFTYGRTAKNQMLAVALRDTLQQLPDLKAGPGVMVIDRLMRKHYTRVSMERYEYLKSQATPSSSGITWLLVIFSILIGGLIYFLWKEDIFK